MKKFFKRFKKKLKSYFHKLNHSIKKEKDTTFNLAEVGLIIIISIVFGFVVGCISTYGKNLKNEDANLSELIKTYKNIRNEFYSDVSDDDLVNSAIDGMVSSLNDPYSYYMDVQSTDEFNQTVDGSYVGIGVTVTKSDDKSNYIYDMFNNSSAAEAGLQKNDIILKINDEDVRYVDLNKLTNYIKGKPNTTINMVVLRDDKEISIAVKRKVIEIPSVKNKIIEGNNKTIGYIHIDTFASNTYAQFLKSLKSLENQNIDSLIIDVRNNPGGQLSQVEQILSLFFNKKTVLYQIDTKGKIESIYSATNQSRKYDIVVLTNDVSASASEILASCFKENYKNATIVGVNTYGKGTIQKAIQLSNGSSLKYTTQKWLTSNGVWLNHKGLEPDVVVEQTEEYKNNPSDDNDLQLSKALEILTK